MYRPNYRRILLTVVALISISATTYAQSSSGSPEPSSPPNIHKINVQDAELKKFASALKDVHQIQVGFQSDFQKAITGSPLSRKQFIAIFRIERSTHKLPAKLSGTQKQEYQKLVTTVVGIERSAERQMADTVKKGGLSVSRFDTIVRAVHSDPALASRLQKIRTSN